MRKSGHFDPGQWSGERYAEAKGREAPSRPVAPRKPPKPLEWQARRERLNRRVVAATNAAAARLAAERPNEEAPF